jgi:predicted Zn-dependent peptidase
MARARLALVVTLLLLQLGSSRASVRDVERQVPGTMVVLPNGLTVVLAESHHSPLVGMHLAYDVGTRDDPAARQGLARLIPWLMVRATKHVAEGQYERLLDATGAFDASWGVQHDRTRFYVTVPSEALALPLWLWSDQMGFFAPRVDDRLIAEALPMLRSERGQKVENVLDGHLFDLVQAELYPPGHPYHGGELRSADGLRGLSANEVRAFVGTHYGPNRAVLVLTGDFDTPHALELVQKYFGPIPPTAPAVKWKAPAAGALGETHLQIAADVEAPVVMMAWPTAALHAPDDSELDVVAAMLSGDRAGWLRWRLVDELQIAASVTAEQRSRALGSVFVIRAVARPGHTTAELAAAIDETLRKLQSAPPDAFSAKGAISEVVLRLVFQFEPAAGRARAYAECVQFGLRGDCFGTMLASYLGITPGRLTVAAIRELPLGRRVVAEVTPTPGAPRSGALGARTVIPR